MQVQTGSSEAGASGAMTLSTGTAVNGAGGEVVFEVPGVITGDGGTINIFAGASNGRYRSAGGALFVRAGSGTSSHSGAGGKGGHVVLSGGEAAGGDDSDNGGTVDVKGGPAFGGRGGSVKVTSGQGLRTSSAPVVLATYSSASAGVSGTLTLSTGTSSLGNTGYTSLLTEKPRQARADTSTSRWETETRERGGTYESSLASQPAPARRRVVTSP